MEGRAINSSMGRVIRYDTERRRLWICGRRVHHGLTGLVLAATGFLLMVHDWQDRSHWFGRQRQA